MSRGLGQLQRRIMDVIERERARDGSALSDPAKWIDSYSLAAELFGADATDTDRRKIARALAGLERRGLVGSMLPPPRRIYF
jgi:hypothetical protein